MSDFNGIILTRKGKNLMAKAQAGVAIKFTKVVLGDGSLPDSQNIEAMQAVINHKMDVAINSITVIGDGTSQVRVVILNEYLEEGFFVREIGLMAQDPDEGEILYAYSNAGGTADFMPSGGGKTVVENQIDLIATVGNEVEVTASVGVVVLALKEDIEDHNEDPDAHSGRLNAMDIALALYQLYSPNYVEFEFWVQHWTMLYGMDNKVSEAVTGTALVKVNKTDNIFKDKNYVISDGEKSETIEVADILDANTVWTRTNLVNSFSAGASIRRTDWTITEAGQAIAHDGGEYYAGDLSLKDKDCDKAVVIRRQDNDATFEVYFRDGTHPDWTRVEWLWSRPRTGGFVDIEYMVPARGVFALKIVSHVGASAVEPVVDHLVFCECGTGLGGNHRPPVIPTIIAPADGATDVGEQSIITTSAYSHPVGTALLGARVQISTTAQFASGDVVFDSGTVPGISVAPPKDVLVESTLYHARALHEDVENGQTDWSSVVSFTTADSFVVINPPVCISPAANSTIGSPVSLTLVSSAFSIEGSADTQSAAQWQIAGDAGFSNVLIDSGEDTVNLTSYNVPDGTVERNGTYYWRVKHKADTEGWGDWSPTTVFAVAALGVDNVCSGLKYTGGGTPHALDAGMDLLGQAGMLLLKSLSTAGEHSLMDTVRGIGATYAKVLEPHSNSAEQETTAQGGVTSFNDNGFTLGLEDRRYNYPGDEYIARIFMKDPRLLDIITWTGDGISGKGEPYDLDIPAGVVMVFRLDADADTLIWHKDLPAGKNLVLNSTGGQVDGSAGIISAADGTLTLGDDARVNALDGSYTAYIFGHDTAADGVVKAGIYSGATVISGQTYNGNTALSDLPQNTQLTLTGKGGSRTSVTNPIYTYPAQFSHAVLNPTLSPYMSGVFSPPMISHTSEFLTTLSSSSLPAGAAIAITVTSGYVGGYVNPNTYWCSIDQLIDGGYAGYGTGPDLIAGVIRMSGTVYGTNILGIAFWRKTTSYQTNYFDGQSASMTVNGTTKYFQGQNAAGTSWPVTENTVNTGSATTASLAIPTGGYIEVGYSVPGQTEVNLGWGIQLILAVNITSGGDRILLDSARGLTETSSSRLALNTIAEENDANLIVVPRAAGFKPNAYELNKSGEQYVYLAIRKP